MTNPDDLPARVAAVETRTDAIRGAINALGEKVAGHQRETREHFGSVREQFTAVRNEIVELRQETRANFRSVEEHFAELRDLIINGRRGR